LTNSRTRKKVLIPKFQIVVNLSKRNRRGAMNRMMRRKQKDDGESVVQGGAALDQSFPSKNRKKNEGRGGMRREGKACGRRSREGDTSFHLRTTLFSGKKWGGKEKKDRSNRRSWAIPGGKEDGETGSIAKGSKSVNMLERKRRRRERRAFLL